MKYKKRAEFDVCYENNNKMALFILNNKIYINLNMQCCIGFIKHFTENKSNIMELGFFPSDNTQCFILKIKKGINANKHCKHQDDNKKKGWLIVFIFYINMLSQLMIFHEFK